MNRLWWSLVCVLALGVTSACDDNGDGGTDAGPDTSTDAGGDGPGQPVLMAFDGSGLVEADLSCLGSRTAPAPGETMDFPVRTVSRGVSDTAKPSTTVQLFADNEVPADASCGAGCIELTTDASGMGTASLAADGWFAYRVLGGDGGATTAQVNAPAVFRTTGGTEPAVELSVVSQELFELAIGTAQVEPQLETAFFTGSATDCAGNPLVGGEIRVFGPGGEIQGGTAPTSVRYVYWGDAGPFPSATQPFTSQQGRYAGANLPPEGDLRMELWGVRTDGGEPELIACEAFPAHPDHVTIIDLGPLRADGPSDCSGS